MTTANVNEVALGIESFGDDDAPLVLHAGGISMLSWPRALRAARRWRARRVVRYDPRDSGESTTADPESPAYTLRDLAADAAALADALAGGPVHLAGVGVGHAKMVAARLDEFLVSSRPLGRLGRYVRIPRRWCALLGSERPPPRSPATTFGPGPWTCTVRARLTSVGRQALTGWV